MKSKLKKICNKIKSFIDKHKSIIKLVIVELSIIIIFTLGVICGYYSNKSNESDYDNIELCSMTTDNNAEDFNKTYSDYICLTAPIVKLGNSPYRCVGSLFLGYEGDNIYLYYPVSYSNGTTRAYEYRRTQCNYGYAYTVQIACQYIQTSSTPINLQFKFTLDRGEHYTTLLKQDIYDIDYFDYHCFVDDISLLDNSLEGYTTVSDYYCYASSSDYRFRLRVYNTSNLGVEPNTYNITDRYNPCLHFNDYSGYDFGFERGFERGILEGEEGGYNIGYNAGYNAGYSFGYDNGVIGDKPLDAIVDGFNSFMSINLFGDVSIGDLTLLCLGVLLFGGLMKIFRF